MCEKANDLTKERLIMKIWTLTLEKRGFDGIQANTIAAFEDKPGVKELTEAVSSPKHNPGQIKEILSKGCCKIGAYFYLLEQIPYFKVAK